MIQTTSPHISGCPEVRSSGVHSALRLGGGSRSQKRRRLSSHHITSFVESQTPPWDWHIPTVLRCFGGSVWGSSPNWQSQTRRVWDSSSGAEGQESHREGLDLRARSYTRKPSRGYRTPFGVRPRNGGNPGMCSAPVGPVGGLDVCYM